MKNMEKFVGLTPEEVAKSLESYGSNRLNAPPHKSYWRCLGEKFLDPLIMILILGAFISIFSGSWIESLGILLAVILSVLIGFFSEYKSEKAFDLLNLMDDDVNYKVLRNEHYCYCGKGDLVVGDVVFLENGEEVPADGTVLTSLDFYVDESKFTGEAEAVFKSADAETDESSNNLAYPSNYILRGAVVVSGNAVFKIAAVGMATEIGKTARSASEITNETTPLQRQLKKLAKVIAIFGFSAAVLLFVMLTVSHYFREGNLTYAYMMTVFMITVSLIVVTVPEGLPMSVTLSLAMSMRKMAQNNILLRKLHAAETIGCATVICTDKTGTLTMNRMELADCFFPSGDKQMLSEAMAVNSTANLNGGEVIGNPTEGALLRYLVSQNIDYENIRQNCGVVQQWPFSSEIKIMGTLTNSGYLHIKGAPEVVLSRCTQVYEADGIKELSESYKKELMGSFQAAQSKGQRTIGFAVSQSCSDIDSAKSMIYLGFAAISDPVRPEVPEVVAACRQAGIKIKIVTGDTALTAAEIGRKVGLVSDAPPIDGKDYEALSLEKTLELNPKLSIISRARPGDKLKLVNTLQESGEIVAVTGDGTNDAPALHHADVGISMGRCGSAIAKMSSDIILLDDSFTSIANAVLWGRALYLNIQRFLVFQLTVNLSAALIALSGPLFNVEMPFTVIQMLWINLIMDTLAALALATEAPDADLLKNPPRRPDAFIINRSMFLNILLTGIFFAILFILSLKCWGMDGGEGRKLTIIFSAFVMLQVWNLFNMRALGSNKSVIFNMPANPVFSWVVLIIIAGQVLITTYGGKMFRCETLDLADWIKIILGTSLIFWLGEALRYIKKKMQKE